MCVHISCHYNNTCEASALSQSSRACTAPATVRSATMKLYTIQIKKICKNDESITTQKTSATTTRGLTYAKQHEKKKATARASTSRPQQNASRRAQGLHINVILREDSMSSPAITTTTPSILVVLVLVYISFRQPHLPSSRSCGTRSKVNRRCLSAHQTKTKPPLTTMSACALSAL